MINKTCKALVVKKNNNNNFNSLLENIIINKLETNEVLIKVIYSSLNYKDMMVFEGNPGLVRKYPHVPGVDVAGIVEKSNSSKFRVGERVIIVARPFGITMNGGLAEFTKAPDHWIEKLPKGLSLKEAIIFGTAGFTSALCLYNYKNNVINNKINSKRVLITGATGGVGLTSIHLFKNSGFEVHALTTKKKQAKILKELGVKKILYYDEFILNSKFPLLKKNYDCIIENLGGETLSTSSSQLNNNGIIFIIGIITSNKSLISLLPFVLRGINFFGVNAESLDQTVRKKVWDEIVFLKDKNLPKAIYNECTLEEVNSTISKIKNNKNSGRTVVKISNFK